jgi:CheY-like chemotaxis protein
MLSAHRILIIDDNEEWRRLMHSMLVKIGFEIIEARSGFEAIKLAESDLPDLVLLDLNMPDLSGIETARRLRSIAGFENIPIILLTSESLQGDCTTAPSPHFDGYVQKDSITVELLDCITKYLP